MVSSAREMALKQLLRQRLDAQLGERSVAEMRPQRVPDFGERQSMGRIGPRPRRDQDARLTADAGPQQRYPDPSMHAGGLRAPRPRSMEVWPQGYPNPLMYAGDPHAPRPKEVGSQGHLDPLIYEANAKFLDPARAEAQEGSVAPSAAEGAISGGLESVDDVVSASTRAAQQALNEFGVDPSDELAVEELIEILGDLAERGIDVAAKGVEFQARERVARILTNRVGHLRLGGQSGLTYRDLARELRADLIDLRAAAEKLRSGRSKRILRNAANASEFFGKASGFVDPAMGRVSGFIESSEDYGNGLS